jgi:hypothetical protein
LPLPAPSDPSDPTPWQTAAACRDLPPSVVFARRAQQAAPALRACARCPVRRECEEAVAPAESWFDGVCAGRLWRNGRPSAAGSVLAVLASADPAAGPARTPEPAPGDTAHGPGADGAARLPAPRLVPRAAPGPAPRAAAAGTEGARPVRTAVVAAPDALVPAGAADARTARVVRGGGRG